jgi:hypothetical protein
VSGGFSPGATDMADVLGKMIALERRAVREALDSRDARIDALETRLTMIEKGAPPREFRARLKVKEQA